MTDRFSPQIYSYITYPEAFPSRRAEASYIQEQLGRFDLRNIVSGLARLNLYLSERKYERDLQVQLRIGEHMFDDRTFRIVRDIMNEHRIVFHRHQLLYLLKSAFQLSGSYPDISFEIPEKRHKLATSCLVANHFLQLLGLDDNDYQRMSDTEKRSYLWKEFLPGFELINPSELKFDVARIRYFINSILPQIPEQERTIDIKAAFQKISGFSIEEYMDYIFAILALYLLGRKTLLENWNNVFITVSNFTRQANIAEERIREFFQLISIPLDEYRDRILGSVDLEYNYGFTTFRQYPVALFDEHRFIILDFHFMHP